jgi:hypothetical protein
MSGKKLSESDQKIYEKSKIILQLSHKYEAYQSYEEMGMPLQALDSLLSGYALWEKLADKISLYDAATETDSIKAEILGALQIEYQITEEDAKEINALDDYSYTQRLEALTENKNAQNDAQQDASVITEDASAPDDAVQTENIGQPDNTVQDDTAQIEDMTQPEEAVQTSAEDALPEEEIE